MIINNIGTFQFLKNKDEDNFKTMQIHFKNKDLKKLLTYVEKLIKFKKLKTFREEKFYIYLTSIINILNNFAFTYIENNDLTIAKNLIIKTIQIVKDKSYLYIYSLELSTLNIYVLYLKKTKNYHKALKILERCLNIVNLKKDKDNMPIIYNNLSIILFILKNYIRSYDCSKISSNLLSIEIKKFNLKKLNFYENFKEKINSYILSLANKAKIENFLNKYNNYKETLSKIRYLSSIFNLKNNFNIKKIKKKSFDSYKPQNTHLNKFKKKINKSNDLKINNLVDFYDFKEVINKKNKKIICKSNNEKYKTNYKLVQLTEKFLNEDTRKNNFLFKINRQKTFHKKKTIIKFDLRSNKLISNYVNRLNKFKPNFDNINNKYKRNKLSRYKRYSNFDENILTLNALTIQKNFRKKNSKILKLFNEQSYNNLSSKGKIILKINYKKILFNYKIYLKEYNAIEIKLYKKFELFTQRIFLISDFQNHNYSTIVSNLDVTWYEYKKNINEIFKKILKNIEVRLYENYEIIIKIENIKDNDIKNINYLITDDNESKYYSNNKLINNFKIKDELINSVITIQKIYRGLKKLKIYKVFLILNSILIDYGTIYHSNNKYKFFILYRNNLNNYILVLNKGKKFHKGIYIDRFNYDFKKIMNSLYIDNQLKIFFNDFFLYIEDDFTSINYNEKKMIKIFKKFNRNKIIDRVFKIYYSINDFYLKKFHLKLIGKKIYNDNIILFFCNKKKLILEILLFKINYKNLVSKLFYFIPKFFDQSIFYLLYRNIYIIEDKIIFKKCLKICLLNYFNKIREIKILYIQKFYKRKKFLENFEIIKKNEYNYIIKIYFLNKINKLLIKIYNKTKNESKDIYFKFNEYKFEYTFLKNIFCYNLSYYNNELIINVENKKLDILNKKSKNKLKFIKSNLKNTDLLKKDDLKYKFNKKMVMKKILSERNLKNIFYYDNNKVLLNICLNNNYNIEFKKKFKSLKIKKAIAIKYFDNIVKFIIRKFIFYNKFLNLPIEEIKNEILLKSEKLVVKKRRYSSKNVENLVIHNKLKKKFLNKIKKININMSNFTSNNTKFLISMNNNKRKNEKKRLTSIIKS